MNKNWHALDKNQVLQEWQVASGGLTQEEVKYRQEKYGLNLLPQKPSVTLLQVFLRQFTSPLVYILLIAAVISAFLKEYTDAGFIAIVLALNALIGTFQEYRAEKKATALQKLLKIRAFVERDHEIFEVDAKELVPGDLVHLESGVKIPADLRLISTKDVHVDESLLTGESIQVVKSVDEVFPENTSLADRKNMVYAGTAMGKGRAVGVVVATGSETEVGKIAQTASEAEVGKPPLLKRMARFTKIISYAILTSVIVLAVIGLYQGQSLREVFFMGVALAVSAIPEGLPVALTIALAVGSSRMANRNVITRRLVALEGLGSCTLIATDKTGTLTCNAMTVQQVYLPGQDLLTVTGEGYAPNGEVLDRYQKPIRLEENLHFQKLVEAIIFSNEAELYKRGEGWSYTGDPTDVALLVLGRKVNIIKADLEDHFSQKDEIPFESELRYSASLNQQEKENVISLKGALEKVLPMCSLMLTPDGEEQIQVEEIENMAGHFAENGYRVLAVAQKRVSSDKENLERDDLKGMVFLGCVAMRDPLRPGIQDSIRKCYEAGIKVVMVTGDHPVTAFAIGRDIGIAKDKNQVMTGTELAQIQDDKELEKILSQKTVLARVEPHQKLKIVQVFQRLGNFVAVTGDGVNDAPALKDANIGVAMGKDGTDVARDAADLVLADDNFNSIVAGIEEGRVAYDNVRKVIFLLISTGAAEIILITLSVIFGLPIPLLPAQLLWLNLVTNGIQDVALAFEPNEGDVLKRSPRPVREGIFNRIMIERTLLASLTMGIVAFIVFSFFYEGEESLSSARNFTLLLMVLFENVHVGNCRSELKSAFQLSPFKNPFLLWGTLSAQLIHIAAMHIPFLEKILSLHPISIKEWLEAFVLALSLLLVMEVYKVFKRKQVKSR